MRFISWDAINKITTVLCMIVMPAWLVFLTCFFLDFFWDMEPKDMNGWVQALGSIGAILATGWAAQHTIDAQRRDAARADRERQMRVVEAIRITLQRAEKSIEQLHRLYIEGTAFDKLQDFDHHIAVLETERDRLAAFNIIEVPKAAWIQRVLDSLNNIEVVINVSNDYMKNKILIDEKNMGIKLPTVRSELQSFSKALAKLR